MLTPPGIPFLAKHIASSFLPGIFPAAGSSAPVDKVGKPPAITAKTVKEKKKEAEKQKAKEDWEKIKKKTGEVIEGAKEIGKNIWGGLKDLTKGMMSSVPDGFKLVPIDENGGGGLSGLFGKDKSKSPSIEKNKTQLPDASSKPKSSFSNVAAGVDKAKNSAGVGQLEQFAFYEDPAAGGGTIVMEVPVPVGAGSAPPTAEESAPVSQGGGKSGSPFMTLYRGDG